MPYGYGESQDYYDRAVQERDRNTGGNTGNNNQNNQVNQESQAAQAASQALHAQQMQEMARGMQAAGQISGGLSGGTYTKGPVVYPKEFYTHEGWSEVQKKGWSDKLANYKIQGYTPSEWILAGDDPSVEGGLSLKDVGGRLQTLPEGMVYSTNIGDPERGWGGFRRVSNFTDGYNNQGGGYGGGYGGGGGGGYGGGGGGGYIEQELPPRGNPNERWGAQTPWQQIMINTHAGKGFRQGYARGGIVSLVE